MKLPKYGKTCVVLEGILCYKFVTIWLAVDIPQILLRIVVQEGKRNRLTYKLSIFSVVRSLKIRLRSCWFYEHCFEQKTQEKDSYFCSSVIDSCFSNLSISHFYYLLYILFKIRILKIKPNHKSEKIIRRFGCGYTQGK